MIWVISDIERASGGRAHEDLLNESIKACQRGFCRDVALVVTKTDKLYLPEYLRYRAGLSDLWAFLRGSRLPQQQSFDSWAFQTQGSDCWGWEKSGWLPRTLGPLGRLSWESEHCGPSSRVVAQYPVGCPLYGVPLVCMGCKEHRLEASCPPPIWEV